MCGILGFTGSPNPKKTKSLLKLIRHRGYDESVAVHESGLNYGMNRLAIQDLTPNYYPFKYKHYSLVFNGEIYNYPLLKSQLQKKGLRFATNCDAEVILPLFELYGLKAFSKIEGMFAIAIIDHQNHTLFLIRDKLGEKPLYFAHSKSGFSFASEAKCLLTLSKEKAIDQDALMDYLRHGSVSKDRTLVSSIKKLQPAQALTYDIQKATTSLSYYWQIPQKHQYQKNKSLENQLESLLEKSVTDRLIADVPVGTFLSGGIDSSLITYYAQQKVNNIRTFSISFPNSGRHDESNHAESVAEILGTNHQTIPFTVDDARACISTIGSQIDEPIVDPAFMPTLLLSKTARKDVKVVLTGEGADEVFGGYYRYYKYSGIQKCRQLIPFYNHLSHLNRFFISHRLKNFMQTDPEYSPQNVWLKAEIEQLLSSHPPITSPMPLVTEDTLRSLQKYDLDWYLPHQLLMKVDKATMQHNLESRAPFLDSTLVSFGYNLPFKYKLHGLHNKYILRQLVSRRISPNLAWRKKHGFSLPLSDWFRDELRDMVKSETEFLIKEHSGIKKEYVRKIVSEHLKNEADNSNKIWSLMVLASWIKANKIHF